MHSGKKIRPVKPKSLDMPTKLEFIGFPKIKTFDYLTGGDLEVPEIKICHTL
jgi:hypothetical protein